MSDTAAIEEDQTTEPTEEEVVAPEAEDRARRMGWAPQDEWRGKEEDWKNAEAFIKAGEENAGWLRERNRKLDHALAQTTAKLNQMTESFETVKEHYTKVEQRAHDRAVKELKAQQKAAVAEGDEAAFERIDGEIEDLRKEATPAKKREATADEDPDFIAWHTDNDWYNEDVEMTVYANQANTVIARKRLVGRAHYDAITAEVKKRFPDHFENPKRKQAAAVEAGGEGAQRGGKQGYQNLPSDAKAVCDRLVADGVLTQKQYCEDYEWE